MAPFAPEEPSSGGASSQNDAGDPTGGGGGGGGASAGGSSAATGGANGATGGATSACLPVLSRCDGEGDTCCAGSVCLDRGGTRRCVQTCTERRECGSLCCAADEATGQKVCADESACGPLDCSDVGGPCDTPGPGCCDGLTCVSSRAPEYSGCRKPCEQASDCDSGCCVPYANAAAKFCADAAACTCAQKDAKCGGVSRCCAGLACTSYDDSGDFACKPTCTTGEDCDTGCCLPIAGTGEAACLPALWCTQ